MLYEFDEQTERDGTRSVDGREGGREGRDNFSPLLPSLRRSFHRSTRPLHLSSIIETRLRSIRLLDDVVYQQTGVGGATLDKRRPDLRDELGYIAPPNRKLPPVPGSNYNTCDRIKRGTVISKPQLPTIPSL